MLPEFLFVRPVEMVFKPYGLWIPSRMNVYWDLPGGYTLQSIRRETRTRGFFEKTSIFSIDEASKQINQGNLKTKHVGKRTVIDQSTDDTFLVHK